jgi:hypothetical protein
MGKTGDLLQVRLLVPSPAASSIRLADAKPGVQRTGVTAAAGGLQRAGLIRYIHGNVTILDRRGLERRSCECYGISKKEFDRLLGAHAPRKDRARNRGGSTLKRL